MKRTLITLLTVCLLLSLCACGKEEAEEPVQILAPKRRPIRCLR